MTQKKFKLSQLNIFLLLAGIIDIIFIIANMVCGGELLKAEALSDYFIFGDYYSNLGFSSYGADLYYIPANVCFPPLAYCIYYFCYLMAPSPSSDILADINWLDFTTGSNTQLIFLMVNLIFILVFGWICNHYFENEESNRNGKCTLLLPIIILLSYPCMLTSLQRGNSAFPVAVLLCISWLFIDSDSKIKKEVALLLIAVATTFKIYPAIMGLYLIKKKDFKSAIRLVIYGAVFFFVPFIWFGGMDGIKAFFGTLVHMSDLNLDQHFGTVRGMVYYLLRGHSSLTAAAAETVGYIFEQIFLAASLFLFFISRKKWQSVLMLSAIMTSYIGGNAHYTFVYYLPALLMFYREQGISTEDPTVTEKSSFSIVITTLITVCFALIFSCPFFFPHGCYFGVSIASYVLWILGAVSIVSMCIKKK